MDQSESVSACGAAITVLVAIELSKSAWVLAVHDPITDKISRRRLDGGDASGLISICERARDSAAGRSLIPSLSSAYSRPVTMGSGFSDAWSGRGSRAGSWIRQASKSTVGPGA